MRIFEFDQTSNPVEPDARHEGIANLLTVLNMLIARAKDQGTDPSLPTQELIAMVTNTGVLFDYNALLDAYETNAAVQKLIKNFSKDTVDLIGSAEDELDGAAGNGEDSGDAVARIAKRVANREIG